MHTNPPEYISLNKYISSTGFAPTGWVLILICLIAFMACKPKDPIMNAAEMFYEKDLISVADIDLLRDEYEQTGKLERRSVLFATVGGLQHGLTMYPPIGGKPDDFKLIPGEVYVPLPENEETLQFFIDTQFFTPTEIGYLQKRASVDKDFTYEKVMSWIAEYLIIKKSENIQYPPSVEDDQMKTDAPQ